RVDGHLVDLDAEHLVTLERPDRLLSLLRVPLFEVRSGWRGSPIGCGPDIHGHLPADDGPELAAVTLLAGLALADAAAHLVPPDARRFTPGKWAGHSGETLAAGLELLQQLVVIAGHGQVVGRQHVHVGRGVPALGDIAGGVP